MLPGQDFNFSTVTARCTESFVRENNHVLRKFLEKLSPDRSRHYPSMPCRSSRPKAKFQHESKYVPRSSFGLLVRTNVEPQRMTRTLPLS